MKIICLISLSLVMFTQNTSANAGVIQLIETETAVCTVLKRVSLDLSKPLTGSNPIESIVTQPTICNGRAITNLEYSGGIRALMYMGWQVTSASHQITPLGFNNASGNTELLLSSIFTIQRNNANKINNVR